MLIEVVTERFITLVVGEILKELDWGCLVVMRSDLIWKIKVHIMISAGLILDRVLWLLQVLLLKLSLANRLKIALLIFNRFTADAVKCIWLILVVFLLIEFTWVILMNTWRLLWFMFSHLYFLWIWCLLLGRYGLNSHFWWSPIRTWW